MLLVKNSSVLLQVRCHCTSGVGIYVLSLPTVFAAVHDTL